MIWGHSRDTRRECRELREGGGREEGEEKREGEDQYHTVADVK